MSSRRLKHFCELCRKQCKDENGFKCHVNSESHQMRVREYASNPLQHIERASKEFEGRFIQMLKTKYPGEPKYLEQLYNELMEEKKFLKFNHTQWKTLADFGLHLQSVRNIKVLGTPPNCRVLYLVSKTKDFIENARKDKIQSDREKEKEQLQKSIASRIDKERELGLKQEALLEERLRRTTQEHQDEAEVPENLEFSIEGFNPDNKRSAFYTTQELQTQAKEQRSRKGIDQIEKIYQELRQQQNQESQEEEDEQWVAEGITVRIKPHDIDPAFHGKKCRIKRIPEPYLAEVTLGTATLEIDQANLETVIPKPGHRVKVLLGPQRGKAGELREVSTGEGFGVVVVGEGEVKLPFNAFSRFDEN